MNRLFQHYEGEIKDLMGKQLLNIKCLYDKDENDVILVWIQSDKSWFRISIDRTHCGVDEYTNDNSQNDAEEDDDLLIEHKN